MAVKAFLLQKDFGILFIQGLRKMNLFCYLPLPWCLQACCTIIPLTIEKSEKTCIGLKLKPKGPLHFFTWKSNNEPSFVALTPNAISAAEASSFNVKSMYGRDRSFCSAVLARWDLDGKSKVYVED